MDGGIDNKEILRQQALNQFKPLIPVNFNKEYTLVISIITLILATMQNKIESFIGFIFIASVIVICTTFIYSNKLHRMGYMMTMSCCLAADAIAFFISTFWSVIINDKSAVIIVTKLFFYIILLVASQSIVQLYTKRKDRQYIKNIKEIEKQRQRYENKINKIFKYKP